MADFKKSIKKVLINEGGYINDPDDRGGETNHGISKRAYPNTDIKNLTLDEAKAIYKRDYWEKIKGDEILNDDVAFNIFDGAVNMGVAASSKLIQIVVNVSPDGVIGKKTLKAINDMSAELLIAKFKLAKISKYLEIVKKHPTNKKYLHGWINRVIS